MGLLDTVIGSLAQGALGGAGAGANQAELLRVVAGLLGNEGPAGGLGGLISKFQQGGLGDVIGSWVGTGQNLPISPDQLRQVLGGDAIGQIAQQLGVSHGDAAGQLAQLLPQAIDHLTPHGQVPAGGLGDMGSLLGALLKPR